MNFSGYTPTEWMERWAERFTMWLAWKMPRGLAKWVAVRVMTYNCDGNPDERTPAEILNVWAAQGSDA